MPPRGSVMSDFRQRLQAMSLESRSYLLRNLPSQLLDVGETKRSDDLLTLYDFLQAKLAAFGPQSLANDYRAASSITAANNDPFGLIHAAILLSAHVLTQDTTQLAGQLLGRLVDYQAAEIQSLMDSAKQSVEHPWLRPLAAHLCPPAREIAAHLLRSYQARYCCGDRTGQSHSDIRFSGLHTESMGLGSGHFYCYPRRSSG